MFTRLGDLGCPVTLQAWKIIMAYIICIYLFFSFREDLLANYMTGEIVGESNGRESLDEIGLV